MVRNKSIVSGAPVLIHLHVPKCAGASVNTALAKRFRGRCYTHRQPSNVREKEFTQRERERMDERYDVVFGHFRYGVHKRFTRKCYYFSATRDPLDRICSFYNFIHTRPQHPLHDLLKKRLPDLSDIDEEIISEPALRRVWKNPFCRTYSGLPQEVSDDNFKRVRRLIVRRITEGEMYVSTLDNIQAMLGAIGVDEIPRRKVTDTSRADDFVPAKAETIDDGAKQFIMSELCYFDYELLSAIQKHSKGVSPIEFGMKISNEMYGFGELIKG